MCRCNFNRLQHSSSTITWGKKGRTEQKEVKGKIRVKKEHESKKKNEDKKRG